MRPRRWAGLTLLVFSMSLVAHAGPPEAERAKSAFRSAQRHYDLGEFKDALDGYAEAYRLNALPAFLFNMAQCHRQLGNYERAEFFYARFLDTAPKESANSQLARDLLKDMKRKQAREKSAAGSTSEVPMTREDFTPYPQRGSETSLPVVPGPGLPDGDRPRGSMLPRDAVPSASASSEPVPLVKKWWFWTAIGVGVAGVVVVAVVTAPKPYPSTLDDIKARP